MGTNYGLSTDEALEKLKEIIKNEAKSSPKYHKNKWLSLIWKTFHWNQLNSVTWFGLLSLLFVIIGIVANVATERSFRFTAEVIEILVLLASSIVLIFCCVREVYLHENEVERLILQTLEEIDYAYKGCYCYDNLPNLTFTETNSVTLIWAYRDNKIVNLPWNLLVEGDVIILGPSHVAPAECRQILSHSHGTDSFRVTLEAGEVYNPVIEQSHNDTPLKPFPRQRFEVLQSPANKILRSYLDGSKLKRSSILMKSMNMIVKLIEMKVIWIILVFSIIVNALRWQLLSDASGSYMEMLLLLPAYTILPMIPTTFPLLWLFVTFYGTARLKTLFCMCVKLDMVPFEPENIRLEHIHCKTAISTFCRIICGDPQGLPRTVNLLHTLGTITTFCCVDKEGILCYTRQVPEKVFFFKDHRKIKRTSEVVNLLDNETSLFMDQDQVVHNEPILIEDEYMGNDVEILSISADPKSKYGIQFDDVNWEEQIHSLKALGINMLLNSPCKYPMKSLRDEDFIRHLSLMANSSVVSSSRECMCSLAKEIGFQERLLNMFKTKQAVISFKQLNSGEESPQSNFFLSIVKEKHVPFSISSIVNDGKHDVSQLLTQGSADLILDACTDVWNGDEICVLKDQDRKKALNFFQRMNITRKCIAFSYRPVLKEPTQLNDVFMEFPDEVLSILSDEEEDHEDSCISTTKKTSLWSKKVQKDLHCEELVQLSPTTKNIEVTEKNLCKQVFLGMVTLTHSLKQDVITIVDQLNAAGVRFVHFSYENELRSRVFCQRLGLETGWNCHISLGEGSGATVLDECSSSAISESCPLLNEDDAELIKLVKQRDTDTSICLGRQDILEDDDDDDDYNYDTNSSQAYENYDELYFMSNRSKLPHGIQNMRAHLQDVDDVPLLVPLFTDCNPLAVSEMIKIMQEYGEIVCCIGSMLNSNNHQIFTQSDITIALEPVLHSACSLKDSSCANASNPGECSLDSQSAGLLSLSASFNSITSSLSCRRTDTFPIFALLCEARRLTMGLQNAFLFLFSCQLSLTFLMLFSSLLLIPPPLTGLQLLWLICIILPILSLSLIGTPADKSLMKMISGKRKEIALKKEFIYPYMKQFVPTFILNILFIVCILFPWLQFTFCEHGTLLYPDCHWVFGTRNATGYWHGLQGPLQGHYFLAQDIVLFYVTISFVMLSSSFVHRSQLLWKKLPFNNKPWCLSIFVCLFLQILCSVASGYYHQDKFRSSQVKIGDVSPFVYVLCVVWLVVLIFVSEMMKRKDIRARVRFQKRERLKFDTKLGMNSPV